MIVYKYMRIYLWSAPTTRIIEVRFLVMGPGYIVGGGHSAAGWQDIEPDARTNEIAVNWQAALVYALAGFTDGRPN